MYASEIRDFRAEYTVLSIGMAISKRLILDMDRTMKTGYSISQWFNCITLKKLYILMQFHYNFQDVDIWLS